MRIRSLRASAVRLLVTAGCSLLPTVVYGQLIRRGPAASATSGEISGTTYDSLGGRILPAATVQLAPAQAPQRARTLVSDADGRFLFDSLPQGTYLLGLQHPLLDSLGVQLPLTAVTLLGAHVRVSLGVPSATTLRNRLCGPQSLRDSTGLLIARLRDAVSDLPRTEGQIRATWVESAIVDGRLQRLPRSVIDSTSDEGLVLLCDLPLGVNALVRGWSGTDSSGAAPIVIPPDGVLRRDVRIAPVQVTVVREAGDGAGPAASALLSGPGILRGILRRPDGRSVAGARVQVTGSVGRDTSDAEGRFVLRNLPLGSHMLEVRAVGFIPFRLAVDVSGKDKPPIDLTLEAFLPRLDAVRVVGERAAKSQGLREFAVRSKGGFGTFFDEGFLTDFNPAFMTDILRQVAGVRIIRGRVGENVQMQGGLGWSSMCFPTVFIEGVRVLLDEQTSINDLVPAQDVVALEVYVRSASVPAQFMSQDGCGSIVIWTGSRKRAAPGGVVPPPGA
jgi:hypothetical protein